MNDKNRSIELADIFRKYQHLLSSPSKSQKKVIRNIINCRTPALGGRLLECDVCHHQKQVYHSCRNRYCPKCGGLARMKWISARMEELLPVPYFHMVFTIPKVLDTIALYHKRVIYNILFKSVERTLKETARKNLDLKIGFIAVLHTWDQQLNLHPHIHCIVPGGGFSPDNKRWISSNKRFFISVKKLSLVFRGKFMFYLKKAIKANPDLLKESDFENYDQVKNACYHHKWVVYSKQPFGGPEYVVKYLGNYTHRIAISNHRIVKVENGMVTFSVKDRKNKYQQKLVTIPVKLFMQRFLLHLLPKRFMRFRYYGFLGSPKKKETIKRCRELIQSKDCESINDKTKIPEFYHLIEELSGSDHDQCPHCGKGKLIFKMVLRSKVFILSG